MTPQKIKRLELIKNLIALEERELLLAQVGKLDANGQNERLEKITEAIRAERYGEAARAIKKSEDEKSDPIPDVSLDENSLSAEQVEHRKKRLEASARRIREKKHHQLVRFFPKTIAPSFIIAFYSLLEETLSNICSIYEEPESCPVVSEDLKGNSISQSQAYLKKIVGLEFPGDMWSRIQERRKIRNCFAHANGQASNDSGVREIVRKCEFELTEEGFLKVSKSFLKDVLQDIECFFERLIEVAIEDADSDLIQHLSETENALREMTERKQKR